MASSQEITNSTQVPLSPFAVFQGKGYRTVGFTSIHFTLQADKVCTLTVEQTTSSGLWEVSDQFSNAKHITTVVDGVADKIHLQCSVIVKGNFYRVRLENTTASTLAITRLFAYPKTSVQQSNIDIRRLEAGVDSITTDQMVTTATRPVYLLDIGSYYRVATVGNTSGAVWNAIGAIVGGESEPTIGRLFKCLSVPSNIEGQGTCYDVEYNTDQMVTSATRPVYLLDIGSYYRVATVGNTSGAVWNAIGAIVGGESIPTIGRLFKCLSVPSNIEGQGTCFDVEYNDNTAITGTVSLGAGAESIGTVRLNDAYGSPLVTTAGNLMVGINNIYTANPLHTIIDSGTVSLGAGTESVGTVRLNDAYGSPLVTTAGNLMVGINNIYTANPLHTIIDSGTVTFTEASSSVASLTTVNATTQTIKASAGTLKSVFLTYDNSSGVTYVKLYDDASPSGATTPLMVIPIVHGTSSQFDCHNLAFATALTIRAVDTFGAGVGSPTGTVYATVLYN